MKLLHILLALYCTLVATFAYSEQQRDWSQYPDFTKLRQEIGWSDNYFNLCQNNRPTKEMSELMIKEKWKDAVVIGLHWLHTCPIDISVHFYTAISFSNIGQENKANHHFDWVKGLMDSITASGNGKTPETAYKTISISEEYDFLRIFELKPTEQSVIHAETTLDVITAENENGVEFTIYFNPEAHFHRLDKMFE